MGSTYLLKQSLYWNYRGSTIWSLLGLYCLTAISELISRWWRIYPSMNWVSISLPVRRQAITWTNADLLSIGPLTARNKVQWNLNRILAFSLKKIGLKMSSGKCRPFCFGLNVLSEVTAASLKIGYTHRFHQYILMLYWDTEMSSKRLIKMCLKCHKLTLLVPNHLFFF